MTSFCLSNDTAVQRRAHEGAQRPTRPSDCNGGLGSAGRPPPISLFSGDAIAPPTAFIEAGLNKHIYRRYSNTALLTDSYDSLKVSERPVIIGRGIEAAPDDLHSPFQQSLKLTRVDPARAKLAL